MATYRELLAQVRAEIDEIGAAEARERQGEALFVDVREREEWEEGAVPGALHVPRGWLESRIEGLVPDRSTEIVLYCSGGSRTVFAAKALSELGYENVTSLTGGFTDWKRNGFEVETPHFAHPGPAPPLLAPPADPRGRRGRPGEAARVARAADRRRRARLARRRSTSPRRASARSGSSTRTSSTTRTCSARSSTRPTGSASRRCCRAKRTIEALNPDVTVKAYEERLTSENVERILADGWDVIVDGADNFPTRYLVNDASVWHGIPVVHGSIYRFEGQVDRLQPARGPLLPLPLPDAAAAGARSELRRGRRARRAARNRRVAAGERGAEAPARRSARRSRAGCSCSTRSGRPWTRSPSSAIPPARSAASTRRSPSTWTTSSSAPGVRA